MIFSNEQEAIFYFALNGQGNGCINALAGSGKTGTTVECINRVSAKWPTYAVGYMVFNKKNQLEAQDKIKQKNVTVKTFNSFGFSFVLANFRRCSANTFTEYGRIQSLVPRETPKQIIFLTAKLVGLLKSLYLNPSLKDATDTCAARGIDAGNNSEWNIEKMSQLALDSLALAKNYPRDGKISFDDQNWLPVVNNWVLPTFDLLFVDEAQDLNAPQFEMVKRSLKPGGRLIMVGDPYQQIYGFRGSLQNGMENFAKVMEAKTFPLTTNYRCSKAVVTNAQSIVKDLQAWDNSPQGTVEPCSIDKMGEQIKIKDAVLSRSNAPLVKICLGFLRKGKSAFIEGKDIAKSLIETVDNLEVTNFDDFNSKLDVWLTARLARLTGWNSTQLAAEYNDRYETLKVIAENVNSLAEVKSKIESLFFDSEYNRVPCIILSTVHKAKGRQFPNVYLLEETFNRKGGKQVVDEDGERNIRYVALTRAQVNLYLVN